MPPLHHAETDREAENDQPCLSGQSVVEPCRFCGKQRKCAICRRCVNTTDLRAELSGPAKVWKQNKCKWLSSPSKDIFRPIGARCRAAAESKPKPVVSAEKSKKRKAKPMSPQSSSSAVANEAPKRRPPPLRWAASALTNKLDVRVRSPTRPS